MIAISDTLIYQEGDILYLHVELVAHCQLCSKFKNIKIYIITST